jgi:hypothetical protein
MTLLFSILPNEIVDKIYDMSGYKNELKKYFQRNVLTLVDPTLRFLSNKQCLFCFIREYEINEICFNCKQKIKGDIMVSAHDSNKVFHKHRMIWEY